MKSNKMGFGAQVSKLMPLILREGTRTQSSILAKGGLSLPHIVILELLMEENKCKMNELARTLSLTMSAVTSIVDRMVEFNFVKRERSHEDRRVVFVSLLKKGRDTVQKITEERRKMANRVFSVFTESEKKEYLRLLRKIYDSLKEKK